MYAMTRHITGARGEGMYFSSVGEVNRAYSNEQVDLHAAITARVREFRLDEDGNEVEVFNRYETTVGRALLREILPKGLSFELINQVLKKKQISTLINECYRKLEIGRASCREG